MSKPSNTPYVRELPAAEALLLACARSAMTPAELIRARELAAGVDWHEVERLAEDHGVGSLAYRNLRRHFEDMAPAEMIERLKILSIATTQSNLSLLKEVLFTVRLGAQGIECTVFKGLITTQLAYGDFSARKCGDIDLLVPESDYPRAKELFLAEGFLSTMSDKAEIACLQSGLWHEDRRLKIDLHWGIPPRELGIHAGEILRNRAYTTLGGMKIPTFSRDDMFLILCVNATKEFWEQRLYAYCDIPEFLLHHADLDWERITGRARALRCERMLMAALGVVHTLYDMPLPALIAARLRETPSVRRVIDELLEQLFNLNPARAIAGGGDRHLYFFRSSPDYFAALIDNPVRRFYYKKVLRHVLSVTPEAEGEDAARSAHVMILLLKKLYRKITNQA
ncbi:MAG: nucleotidyltransferase family protein [Gammaproteobacteria bacterium]|nr:nucleotidyltransferase family protein [Gammaproteobacteria bacterium]